MRWLALMLFPALVWAQEFEFTQEWDSIQVEIDGYVLPAPWTGGYGNTRPAGGDLDADGDVDLFVGHGGGSIVYYQNLGTPVLAAFGLSDPQWQGLTVQSMATPTFCDMDADGDSDLVIECGEVPTYLYENIGGPGSPLFNLISDTLRDGTGTPIDGTYGDWVDIDADGDLDFFTGTWYSGYIRYYRNDSTGWNYSLTLANPNLLGVGLGYRTILRFCDIDADDDQDLFIGDYYGQVHFYRNDGTPQNYSFTPVSSQWLGIDVGDNASPEFADMDADGDFDLWVGREAYDIGAGNTPGDVFYYENTGTPQLAQFQLIRTSNLTLDAGLSNRPQLVHFSSDSTFDLLFSNVDYLSYYRNIGTSQQPYYTMVSENLLPSGPSYTIELYDLNADGLLDLICANPILFNPEILFYVNDGTPQDPDFRYAFSFSNLPYTQIYGISLADLDGDGDGDMVFGTWGSGLVYYQNQGTPQSPNLVFETNHWQNIPSERMPCLVDMEGDGDYDLLAGFVTTGVVELWENVGTPQNPQVVLADSDLCGTVVLPEPTGADVDNDGDIDLLVGTYDGGIYFFRNTTGDTAYSPYTKPRPQRVMDLSLSPQPGNPTTSIFFQLPYAQEVDLAVYNLLGARVATITSGRMNAGSYSLPWESSGYASGINFVRLATSTETLTRKLTVMK